MKKCFSTIIAAALICCAFSGCSNSDKEPEFSGLPQGDPVVEEESVEYNPDDIIDRMEYNILDYYTNDPSYIKPQKIERLMGKRQGVDDIFDRMYFNGHSFDISYQVMDTVNYKVYKENHFLIIERNDGALKYKITKVASESSNEFWNPEDEACIAKNAEFEEIKSKYSSLYTIACNDCYEHTGEPYYDDTPLGGYYTYAPMVDWILKNGYQYEVSMYSDSQVKDILSLVFDIPENFYYSASAKYSNRCFGLSGCFKSKDDASNGGYQYYLLYSDTGIYAIENYFASTQYYSNDAYMRFVVPSHTDADLYNTNEQFEYVLREDAVPSLSKT